MDLCYIIRNLLELRLHQPLFSFHSKFLFLRFILFLPFFPTMAPSTSNLEEVSTFDFTEIIFFCRWKYWAQVSLVRSVFKHIRCMLTISSDGFTDREIRLPLNFWNLWMLWERSTRMTPNLPKYSVLWKKYHIGSLRQSKCVKCSVKQYLSWCSKTQTLLLWESYIELSINLRPIIHPL